MKENERVFKRAKTRRSRLFTKANGRENIRLSQSKNHLQTMIFSRETRQANRPFENSFKTEKIKNLNRKQAFSKYPLIKKDSEERDNHDDTNDRHDTDQVAETLFRGRGFHSIEENEPERNGGHSKAGRFGVCRVGCD